MKRSAWVLSAAILGCFSAIGAVTMPEDALYMPSGLGTKVDLPKAGQKAFPPWKEVAGTFVFEPPMYPGPGYSMPWLAVTDGKRCLYWQAEQLNRAPLRFCVSFDPGTKEIAVSAGQPLVFERLAGGWHAAAKTYRAMWNCAYKLASKTAAIREMTGFLLVILKQQNGEIIWPYTEFEELADRCEERGMNWVGLFGWTRGGHDTLYPEYEPDEAMGGRAALEKGIALLQRRGIKVVLYANGQLQERATTDYWRTYGKDACLLDENGNPRGETWQKYSDAPAHHFDYACLSMPCWHEAMKKVARLAAELGADGLLYDQLGTTAPRTCFSKNHRHVPGAHVYAADRAELLDNVLAEAKQINPQFLLLTEGLHDSLLSSVAAYHGWVKGTYPKQGIAFLDPDPPALDYPPFPFLFQYTFPELVCTVRTPTPLVARDWANYAALIGMRHEIEIRYAPDRRYIRDGKKPREEDYGTIRQKPDLASMLAEDGTASRDYLKALTSLQRRFADIFYGGRFTDNEGFSCAATSAQVIAKSFTGENRMGVVVCNLGTESAQIDVKTDRCFVGAYEPEAGKVDPATPLAAKTLRVYVATADRKEYPYAFRAELETVHEQDMRDVSLKPAADECAFQDGMVIAIPEGAGEVLINAAKDFLDYLLQSQGVSVRVGFGPVFPHRPSAVIVSLVPSLAERQYTVAVSADGVKIAAKDERAAAQALYYLEDLMNLRRAPFLKVGNTTRSMRFTSRMVHSAWGMDIAPEKYIERMAHYGYDSLLIYVKKVGKTKSSAKYEDINAIIRRAKRHGVDVWLYTSVTANVHPDDPGAQAVFDATYGEIARAYPEAKGVVLVGESCAFPSKDERACSDPYEVKQARGDKRPAPGWFPCRDYPDWLRCVKKAINRHAPEIKVLFWTYNWSKDWTPETASARLELIDHLPKENTVLLSTFEMPEKVTFPNGYSTKVSDYSITCPGPGKVFVSEAKKAQENKLDLFTMCNTGGHTWDFGTSPFQPIPYQWAKRWRALVKAHDEWGLSGLMETHHYGWFPNFVSELAKEAYTDGGMPMAEHIRKIAARDYGGTNADEVVAIWKNWSEKGANHLPTLGNQYGPFRIGPAYPFNFGGRHINNDEFPSAQYAAYGIGICHLNFTEILWGERMYDLKTVSAEIDLLKPYADALMDGAKRFTAMAAQRDGRQAKKARQMAVLAEYIGRSVITAINMKRGALAWEAKDDSLLRSIAREEYINAEAALSLVDADSRLGFECSMEYGGGREQIEWKLRRMREIYPGLFGEP